MVQFYRWGGTWSWQHWGTCSRSQCYWLAFRMSSQASVFATSSQLPLHSIFSLLFFPSFILITTLLLIRMKEENNPESICSFWKNKKAHLVNWTVVPGPPHLGSWPERGGKLILGEHSRLRCRREVREHRSRPTRGKACLWLPENSGELMGLGNIFVGFC